MTRVWRQVRAELLLLAHSRRSLGFLGVLLLGVLVAYAGSRSAAQSAIRTFAQQVKAFEERGISLQDALAAPMSVTTSGQSETIDNPLKYDFLELSERVRATESAAMASTALDLVTFLVMPLLFLFVGASMALVDRSAGTVGWRASRERWPVIALAKVLAIGTAGFVAAALTAAFGAVVGAAGSLVLGSVRDQAGYPLPIPDGHPLVPKVLMTAAVALVFGALGQLVGTVTRSTSWPLVLAALALFMAPFLVAWDPRNLMASFGRMVYDFWGQFSLRPPLEVTVGGAAALAAGQVLLLAAALAVVSRRAPMT